MEFILTPENERFSQRKTMVFVDFEAWLYGCINQFHTEPDIVTWFEHVKTTGDIQEVLFFADTSAEPMQKNIMKLRNISNNIIDCSKGAQEKDYTDFIMLDHIYQNLIRRKDEIEQFILFTGDGHFQNAAAFLRRFNNKIIGVYSLKGALSRPLAETANWVVEIIPANQQNERKKEICKMITDNLIKTEENGQFATFMRTVDAVNRAKPYFKTDEIRAVLSEMINRNEVRQVDAIFPNWGTIARKLVVNRKA